MNRRRANSGFWLGMFIALLFWVSYFAVIWSRQFVIDSRGWWAGSLGTWGDGAAHLTYMGAFAFRSVFPLTHPLFVGRPFSYGFLADLFGGLLVRLGLSLPVAYVVWGFVLSVLTVLIFYWFVTIWSKKWWIALLSIFLFLWSGGLGWVRWIEDGINHGWRETLLHPTQEYTHLMADKIVWINILTSELLPQRAFLLGLPVGLLVLGGIVKASRLKQRRNLLLAIAGVLFGLLPIIHSHTFFSLSIVVGWWFLVDIFWQKKIGIAWLWFILPAIVLSGGLIAVFILPALHPSFFRFLPGWMSNPASLDDQFLWFWFKNAGFLPVAILGGWFVISREQRWLVAPFLGLFVIANVWLIQPWDWDNTKIFTWVLVGMSVVVAYFLEWLWQKRLWGKILAILLFFNLTLSGMLDAWRLLTISPIGFLSADEMALGERVLKTTKPDSLFLTAPVHNHWLPVTTGRQIVMGFTGWLWSYGIDYGAREREVRLMYAGGAEAQALFDRFGVDYVVIGPAERSDLKANQIWFDQTYPVFLRQGDWAVYAVSPL